MSVYSPYEVAKRKKRLIWDEACESVFLEIWSEKLEDLRKSKRKAHIYSEIAAQMTYLGYKLSTYEVQTKLRNFSQRYRKESLNLPSTWRYYDAMHQMMSKAENSKSTEMKNDPDDEISDRPSTSLSSSPSPLSPNIVPPPPVRKVQNAQPPSTSASASKKENNDFFGEHIIGILEQNLEDISTYLRKSEELDEKFLAVEKEKAESLKKIANDNAVLTDALVSFLKKQ